MKFFIFLITLLNATSLTIYNNNIANIKFKKEINFKEGVNSFIIEKFSNNTIIDSIYATLPKEVELLEQTFNSNLVTFNKLLKQNLNKEVKFFVDDSTKLFKGELIHINPITIKSNEGYFILNNPEQIVFSIYPHYSLSSNVEFRVKSKKEFSSDINISYLSRNLNWRANYIINVKNKKLNLRYFANIANRSSVDFKDVNISLISRSLKSPIFESRVVRKASYSKTIIPPTKSWHYYKYQIPYKIDLLSNQNKEVLLLDNSSINYKEYGEAYTSNFINSGIERLRFSSVIEFSIDMPLSSGVVRVYKNSDYLGEDEILNTPKSEPIRIRLGDIFNVVGKKVVSQFIVRKGYKRVENIYIIKNKDKKAIVVKIKEKILKAKNIKLTTTCNNSGRVN